MTAMTFTHDDIRERLVDYLYGQLDDDARAAFQAHLDTCPACREEVGGAERARVVAREVVRRPLGDAVPERVRARAFEAARAAAARPRGLPVQEKPQAAAVEGWFGRLRRRWTWTFPTFATVAAMAVFLLVRATIFREAKSPLGEERARELARPAAAPAAEPAAPDAVRALPPGDQGLRLGGRGTATDRAAIRDSEAPSEAQDFRHGSPAVKEPGESDTGPRVRRSPPGGGVRHRGVSSPSGLPATASSGAGAPPPAAAPARKPAPHEAASPGPGAIGSAAREQRQPLDAEKKVAEKKLPDESNQTELEGLEPQADRDEAGKTQAPRRAAAAPKREFAAPPPPPAPQAPAMAAPPAKGGAPAMLDMPRDDADAASVVTQKSGKKSKTSSKTRSEANKDDEPASVATPQAQSRPGATDKAGASAPDPALARASRADTLIAQRRWGEAIVILRDLLRQYPTHASVPTWRQRLAAAQAAQAAETGQFAAPPR